MNDFANGFATLFRQASSARVGHRSRAAGPFVQDDWRGPSGFSISFGLRWEFNIPYFDIRDRVVSFRAGVQSRIFPDAPTGLVYPGDPAVSRSTYSGDLNDFSPRFGFTWDVSRNGSRHGPRRCGDRRVSGTKSIDTYISSHQPCTPHPLAGDGP
jgi:hypothetical protein